MSRTALIRVVAVLMALAAPAPATAWPQQQPSLADQPRSTGTEFFEKKVRPLLAQRCYGCHGPKEQKSGLRLDSVDSILTGGDRGPALVASRPQQSRLIRAIEYRDADLQMPPKGKLAEEEIALLAEWVRMGAPGPRGTAPVGRRAAEGGFDALLQHWAYQPVRRPQLPRVADSHWATSPIDHFILARLEAAGLKPAEPAGKRTLIRRVTFDLIGLPPTPGEIEAFLADSSAQAYERLVDRLLPSPHYGERWARHWLDLVRFAETLGHEFDYEIFNAWRYRDYVIRAFNADVPYDQFVVEHLAGDLLEDPRRHPTERYNESIIGTGFFWLGEGKHSPVDVRQEQADRIDNQIDVLGKSLLAQTIGCSRCHDHKFDPITMKDYYALAGVLKSSRNQQAFIDPPERIRAKARHLAELKSRLSRAIRDDAGPGLSRQVEEVAAYLLAAREVHFGERGVATEDGGDILLDDFESADYQGWTTTGSAFGSRPLSPSEIARYQGDVAAAGNGFVNTHNVRRGDAVMHSDDYVGTLTSSTFVIKRRYIHFLVGGGAHQGKTCINLLVNDAVVASATGQNSNQMKPARFDAAAMQGKQARLQIVDNVRGGWGNIGVDHIVFSDEESVFTADGRPLVRPVKAVAGERGLNDGQLRRWVEALGRPELREASHPLYAWSELVQVANGDRPQRAEMLRASVKQHGDTAQGELFEDFNAERYEKWFVTGDAFGDRPSRSGEILVGAGENSVVDAIVRGGQAHSGLVSRRLEGVLRSRSFTIEANYLHFLAAGRKGRINLVIDGFTLIRDPIYGGLTMNVNDMHLAWRAMDVKMWRGHRAYIELVDSTTANATQPNSPEAAAGRPGDGYITVDEIRLSDHAEAPARLAAHPVNWLVLNGAGDASLTALAKRYERIAASELKHWQAGTAATSADHDLLDWLLENDLLQVDPANHIEQLAHSYAELDTTIPAPRRAVAMADGTGEDEFVFLRGDYKTPGDRAPRRLLAEVCGHDQPAPSDGSGRLAIAQRIVDRANPLTARVMVNRLWLHHFGTGLVPSPDDFGHMGQLPTHPELLDYLASEFVAQGWSIKAMHRLMVLSSTYRMSATVDPVARRRDPQNRLWHHMPVRRLEAEAIRDNVLAVSGELKRAPFGPGVMPHLTPFMEGRGRPGVSGPLDGDGRRSIYVNVRRNFLTPMFLAFDYPIPFTARGRRGTSNVPAQALTMLNSSFVIDQAKKWARRVLGDDPPLLTQGQRESKAVRERISQMYITAFARPPSADELADAIAFLEQQSARYEGSGTAELQAWADLCHVLMNGKEFIFIN